MERNLIIGWNGIDRAIETKPAPRMTGASSSVHEDGAVAIKTVRSATRTKCKACCAVSGTRSNTSKRRPFPLRPRTRNAASPRFLANHNSPPKSAKTSSTMPICSVSCISAVAAFLQHLLDSNRDRVVDDDHFGLGQLHVAGKEREGHAGRMIRPQYRSLLQLEDLSDAHGERSQLEFDDERQLPETL